MKSEAKIYARYAPGGGGGCRPGRYLKHAKLSAFAEHRAFERRPRLGAAQCSFHTGRRGCGDVATSCSMEPQERELASILNDLPAMSKTTLCMLPTLALGAFTKQEAYLMMKPQRLRRYLRANWIISRRKLSEVACATFLSGIRKRPCWAPTCYPNYAGEINWEEVSGLEDQHVGAGSPGHCPSPRT